MRLFTNSPVRPTIPTGANPAIPTTNDIGLVPTDFEPPPPLREAPPTFMDVAERIGSDNETVRNLLRDIDVQFGAVDDLKSSFGRVVEPLHKLADTLSHEKLENAGLRGALSELRTNYNALRAQQQTLESKSSELEIESHRLGQELNALKMANGALAGDKVALTAEVATLCTSLAGLEKQLQEKTNDVRILTEDKRLLHDRVVAAEKRMLELGLAAAIEREKASLLEGEKASLQTSLDRALDRASQTSRELSNFEKLLAESGERLDQLAALEDERRRLSAACDEANHRREAEVEALTSQLDAARSRSTVAENQCADLRHTIAAQAEQINNAETRLAGAEIARIAAEDKVASLSTSIDDGTSNVRKLEDERSELLERWNALCQTATTREEVLEAALEKINSLTHRIEIVKADAGANRTKAEQQIEQLKTDLERSRMERGVAEGALQTVRTDLTRVQREMTALQHQYRGAARNFRSEQGGNDVERNI